MSKEMTVMITISEEISETESGLPIVSNEQYHIPIDIFRQGEIRILQYLEEKHEIRREGGRIL